MRCIARIAVVTLALTLGACESTPEPEPEVLTFRLEPLSGEIPTDATSGSIGPELPSAPPEPESAEPEPTLEVLPEGD